MFNTLYKTKIDFEALEKWRDAEKDDLPPVSFISVYKALGIIDVALKHQKDNPEFKIVPLDNIHCNIGTNIAIKKFLEKMWSVYSLKLSGDNQVMWDTSKWAKGKKHYAKTLQKSIKASLDQDYALYCPGLDNDLGVNEIEFGLFTPDEEEKDANV